MIGQTVSRYLILDVIGEGGMGTVYRAEDTRLGRAVALKFLQPSHRFDSSAKARFLREARFFVPYKAVLRVSTPLRFHSLVFAEKYLRYEP